VSDFFSRQSISVVDSVFKLTMIMNMLIGGWGKFGPFDQAKNPRWPREEKVKQVADMPVPRVAKNRLRINMLSDREGARKSCRGSVGPSGSQRAS
jgi:hypothetical protein